MIGWAAPTYRDDTTATFFYSNVPFYSNGPTVTTMGCDLNSRYDSEHYVIVIESRHTDNDLNLPKWSDVLGNESIPQRRRHLSLEAVKRFVALARRSRLHVQSVWSRVVHVARVCAQSERWRVLAS